MNSSNTSELSVANFSSDSFNTTIDVAFVTAINESSTPQSNFTDIVSSAVQSTWQDSITQDTYFLVYIVSLAGIILFQLAKGFAGAKVGIFFCLNHTIIFTPLFRLFFLGVYVL